MTKILSALRSWFAGTIFYDDEPCQLCAHATCVCLNLPSSNVRLVP